jgi:hypothetical protein
MRVIRQVINFLHPQVSHGGDAPSSPDALFGDWSAAASLNRLYEAVLLRPWITPPVPCH